MKDVQSIGPADPHVVTVLAVDRLRENTFQLELCLKPAEIDIDFRARPPLEVEFVEGRLTRDHSGLDRWGVIELEFIEVIVGGGAAGGSYLEIESRPGF